MIVHYKKIFINNSIITLTDYMRQLSILMSTQVVWRHYKREMIDRNIVARNHLFSIVRNKMVPKGKTNTKKVTNHTFSWPL